MTKILLSTLLSATLVTLYSGCSSTPSSPNKNQESASHSSSALYTQMHNDKKLKQLTIKAAKEKGWRVTNFTNNSIIVEKVDTDNPKAATISIRNGVVDFDYMDGTDEDDIVDLKEYLEDLTNAEKEGY